MNKPLSKHDERQSTYRGDDNDVRGQGRDDPSATAPTDGQQAFHPRGHGKGGTLGEGEPDGHVERDGTTQPDFGQHGSYGASGGTAEQTPRRKDKGKPT